MRRRVPGWGMVVGLGVVVVGLEGFGRHGAAYLVLGGGAIVVAGARAIVEFCLGFPFAAHDTFGEVVVCRLCFVGAAKAADRHPLFPFLGGEAAEGLRRTLLFSGVGVVVSFRRVCLFEVVGAALRRSAFPSAGVVPMVQAAFLVFLVPVVVFSAAWVCWRA